MRRKSKFEFEIFSGDDGEYFVVNADKYTLQEALDIYHEELNADYSSIPTAGSGYVFYGIGVGEDGGLQNGWWLEIYVSEKRNRIPVHVFEL